MKAIWWLMIHFKWGTFVIVTTEVYFIWKHCIIAWVSCWQGGIWVLTLLNDYSASYSLMIVCFCELIAVNYVYGELNICCKACDLYSHLFLASEWLKMSPNFLIFVPISQHAFSINSHVITVSWFHTTHSELIELSRFRTTRSELMEVSRFHTTHSELTQV